jgi:hypothetical protein
MKRARLKLVHRRKPPVDDLSFMPPYAEQAKYLALANAFLARNGFGGVERRNLIDFNDFGKAKSEKKRRVS